MDLLILLAIAFVQTVLSMPYQILRRSSESKHHKLDHDWVEEARDNSETPMVKTRFHWLPAYRGGKLVDDPNSPLFSEQILTRIRRILADY
ncbi:hypothetical protein ACTXT7_000436 [Hymenolepis weldensis]